MWEGRSKGVTATVSTTRMGTPTIDYTKPFLSLADSHPRFVLQVFSEYLDQFSISSCFFIYTTFSTSFLERRLG